MNVAEWPRVGLERHDWHDTWTSYEAALVPAVSGVSFLPLLDPVTAAAVGAAQEAVSSFDARLSAAFGTLELGTISTVLLRSEASSSSQIEHLTASARQLALAELGYSRSVNAQQIRANVDAMEQALSSLATFDTDHAVAMQRTLLAGSDLQLGVRSEQVWIGTQGSSPVGAEFVAPHHSRVTENLDDLWRFAAEDPGALPLARAAILHAQFETIHPFVDGNGRVGRALVHQYLRTVGLTSHVTVPVSAGLLADTSGYVAALTAYRLGDVVPIIEQFARAARNAAQIGDEMIAELRQVRASWNDRLTARSDSVVWAVCDMLVGHPAVTADLVAQRQQVTSTAARTGLGMLESAGIITKVSAGTRNRVWVAQEITGVYDRAAVLIGRRKSY